MPATPTPAADGNRIIANFGVGAACLDFEGNLLWRKPDPGYIENSRYGAATSPSFAGDLAIVVQECEDYSQRPTWIAAFNKHTGERIWRIEPENVRGCYTTPTLYRDNSGAQLIIASLANLASYDIETSKRLWWTPISTWQLVASMARAARHCASEEAPGGQDATVLFSLAETDRHSPP